MDFRTPDIDWAALAPVLVLMGTSAFVLLVGVFLPRGGRRGFGAFFAALGLLAAAIVAGVLFAQDETASLTLRESIWRDRLAEIAPDPRLRRGPPRGRRLLLGAAGADSTTREPRRRPTSPTGSSSSTPSSSPRSAGWRSSSRPDNLMALFLGLEWFSIALYILTAISVHRLSSLEAGLKYLIVGSFGSAILLFGSALRLRRDRRARVPRDRRGLGRRRSASSSSPGSR